MAVLLKRALFDKVGYEPHAGQRAIHKSEARHRIAACGRRFGKSVIGGHELFVEAAATRFMLNTLEETGKRREFWIVGPEYSDSEKEFRVVYDALKKRDFPFDRPGTYNNPETGDMQISLYNRKFIIAAKSAKHPERLVGEGLAGAVMAEAAKMKRSVWIRYVRPMLADSRGWSLWNSTPEGKNWFYDLWMEGQSAGNEEWESWRRPSWLNPYVYPLGATERGMRQALQMKDLGINISAEMALKMGIDLEIASLLNDLTREAFAQEIEARFSEFVGRVLQEFDEEDHVRDLTPDPDMAYYACCDYGFTNPFVWLLLQVDRLGNVYVLDEIYQTNLTIDDAAALIKERGLCPPGLVTFYPDPASPGDTKVLEKVLRVKAGKGTGGEINKRIRIMRMALKVRNLHLPPGHPERIPKLIVNRKCKNTVRELNDWRYPRSEAEASSSNLPEVPLKKDDHCPEALGRFFAGYFGLQDTRITKTRVTEANMTA